MNKKDLLKKIEELEEKIIIQDKNLIKLTSAYSAFVNGGKLVSPILIDRIQDSEGNTILNNEQLIQ